MFIDGLTIAGIISILPIVLFVLVYGRTLPEEEDYNRESDRISTLDCCTADR